MTVKFLLALLFAWLAWRWWRGDPRRRYPLKAREEGRERDARRVLGVGPEADAAAIRAAHRRLVADAHPDRGGSEEATRRLNAARDRLLGRDR